VTFVYQALRHDSNVSMQLLLAIPRVITPSRLRLKRTGSLWANCGRLIRFQVIRSGMRPLLKFKFMRGLILSAPPHRILCVTPNPFAPLFAYARQRGDAAMSGGRIFN
jgi:hypothetical protein